MTVGLEALENLLGVMENSTTRIDVQTTVIDHGVVSPAVTGLPGGKGHVVDENLTKSGSGMFQRDPLVGGPRQIISRSKAQTHGHTLHRGRTLCSNS